MSPDPHVWLELQSLRMSLLNIKSLIGVNLTRLDSLIFYFLTSSKSNCMKVGDVYSPTDSMVLSLPPTNMVLATDFSVPPPSMVLSLPSTKRVPTANFSVPPPPTMVLSLPSTNMVPATDFFVPPSNLTEEDVSTNNSGLGSDVSNLTNGTKGECDDSQEGRVGSGDETVLSSRPKVRRILQRGSEAGVSEESALAKKVKKQPKEVHNQESNSDSLNNPLSPSFVSYTGSLFSSESLDINKNNLSDENYEKFEEKSPPGTGKNSLPFNQ